MTEIAVAIVSVIGVLGTGLIAAVVGPAWVERRKVKTAASPGARAEAAALAEAALAATDLAHDQWLEAATRRLTEDLRNDLTSARQETTELRAELHKLRGLAGELGVAVERLTARAEAAEASARACDDERQAEAERRRNAEATAEELRQLVNEHIRKGGAA